MSVKSHCHREDNIVLVEDGSLPFNTLLLPKASKNLNLQVVPGMDAIGYRLSNLFPVSEVLLAKDFRGAGPTDQTERIDMLNKICALMCGWLLLCSPMMVNGQFSGGYGAGQNPPTKVERGGVSAGPSSDGVNLFNGTLQMSYDFGSVATLSGLSFPLQLSYSGMPLSGYEAEHSSGIPYGEGWQLTGASVTVETHAFGYKYGDLPRDNNFRPLYSRDQSREDGQLYFSNPKVSLPGGVSGRLVYKYPKENDNSVSIYVLQAFGQYVEAAFTGTKWEVKMPNGTIYVFSIAQFNHRNPSNNSAHLSANLVETVLPRAEVTKWHLSEIYNPNHANGQKILFEYDLFGKYDPYQELQQRTVRDSIAAYEPIAALTVVSQTMIDSGYFPQHMLYDSVIAYGNPVDERAPVYQDVFLRAVSAVDAQGGETGRTEFKYKSWRPENEATTVERQHGAFLELSDPQVTRIDSLYSRKVVWHRGIDDSYAQAVFDRGPVNGSQPFDDNWQRYQHPMAHQNPLSRHRPAIGDDQPYLVSFPSGLPGAPTGFNPNARYWASRAATDFPSLSLPFTHSVLESERIEGLPSGDLYQLRSIVEVDPNLINADMNFDLRVTSGVSPGHPLTIQQNQSARLSYSNQGETFDLRLAALNSPSGYFENGYEIFSTEENLVKWNPAYQQRGIKMVTDNTFRLPNLPNEFGGFVVQIGPGSDHLNYSEGSTNNESYVHRYNNYWLGLTAQDSIQLRMSSWFGTGAPPEPMFRTDRWGLIYDGQPPVKGSHWLRHLWWYLDPLTNFPAAALFAAGANQPTAVTRERLHNNLGTISYGLNQGTMDDAHQASQDSRLYSMELARIAKNPYLLDSVVHYAQGRTYGGRRIPVHAWKLQHQLAQVPVLNNVNPEDTFATYASPYRMINGDTLYRNIFQLVAVRRLGTDTIGRIAGMQGITRWSYKADDRSTPELCEAGLVDSWWNELGGKRSYVYMPGHTSLVTRENVPRLSPDQSHDVIGKGNVAAQWVMVKSILVEDEQGLRQTDHEYFNPVVFYKGFERDLNFRTGMNAYSSSDRTWGFSQVKVWHPSATNDPNARAHTEYFYRSADATHADTLLYGRLEKTEEYNASGQITRRMETQFAAHPAYRNGQAYRTPALWAAGGMMVEASTNKVLSYEPRYLWDSPERRMMGSWFVYTEGEKTTEFDTLTGNAMVSQTELGYYDWDTAFHEVGNEYAEMYRSPLAADWFTDWPNGYIRQDTNLFVYGAEPSWQLAWKRSFSDDLPGAFSEERMYYLWDIEPFLRGFGTMAERFIGSFRPFYLTQKYGIRNTIYEQRRSLYNGDPQADTISLSTYFDWEVFDDVPGDFVQWTDSSNYGQFCNEDDPGGFQRGLNHAIVHCFGEGKPVFRQELSHEIADDPRYVRDGNGQWFFFPIESYSAVDFAVFNELPNYGIEQPTGGCSGGYVSGPSSTIKYSGSLALPNGGMLSAISIWPTEVEAGTYPKGEKAAMFCNLSHEHEDGTRCDEVHGMDSGASFDPNGVGDGNRQNFIDMLSQQFFLRSVYQQADTVATVYQGDSIPNVNFPSPHNLWDTLDTGDPYHSTPYRFVERLPYPTVRTQYVHERNMHGQIVEQSDARHLHTLFEYSKGYFRYWFDSCGTARSGLYREDFGLPQSVTVTDFGSILETTTFDYHRNRQLKGVIHPNGEQSRWTYETGGRMAASYMNGKIREEAAYHQWNGDIFADWQARTGMNFVEAAMYQNGGVPQVRTRSYIDPLGRNAQEMVGTLVGGNWTKQFAGTPEYDRWDRPISGGRPTVKYNQTDLGFDPQLVPTLQAKSVFEQGHASRPQKSADFGQSLGDTCSRVGHTIVPVSLMANQTGLTTAQLQELFPFYNGPSSTFHLYKTVVLDPDNKWSVEYKDAGGRTVLTQNTIGVTRFIYDVAGNLVKVIKPNGTQTLSRYNVLGWVYEKSDPDGGISRYFYNQAGDVRISQDAKERAAGRFLLNHYDRKGRVLKTESAALSPAIVNGSNADLFPLYYRDTLFRRFRSIHTMTDELQLEPGDANSSTTFSWPPAEHAFPYIYFPVSAGRKLAEYRYDYPLDTVVSGLAVGEAVPSGLPQQQWTRGRLSLAKTYDVNGRLQEQRYLSYDDEGHPAWEWVQFGKNGIGWQDPGRSDLIRYESYDRQGALRKKVIDIDADGVQDLALSYSYDGQGRSQWIYLDVGYGPQRLAHHSYDDATGHLRQKLHYAVDPACGSQVVDTLRYTYDVRDRLKQFRSAFFDLDLYHDGETPGLVKHDNNYNGLVNGWKATYRVRPKDFKSPTTYGFRYDGINRLLHADADMAQGGGSLYAYPDAQSFGTNMVAGNPRYKGDAAYAYDAAGNITGLWRFATGSSGDNWTYQYAAGTNRLTQLQRNNVVDAALSYDVAGNLTADSRRKIDGMVYDHGNRSLGYVSVAGDTVRYAYGGGGSRAYKWMRGAGMRGFEETYYLNAGGTQAIWDSKDNAWTFLLDGIGEWRQGKLKFYIHDHLGNLRVSYRPVVDAQTCKVGLDVLSVVDYFPYGKVLRAYYAEGEERFMTTGHERDAESGLDYRGARYYDSDYARFLSLDPLAAEFPGWSAYNYVMGNPVSLVDPEGLAPTEPPSAPGSVEGEVHMVMTEVSAKEGMIGLRKSEWIWHGGTSAKGFKDSGWMQYGEYAAKIKQIVQDNSKMLEDYEFFVPWAKTNSKYDPAMPGDLGLKGDKAGEGFERAYVEAYKALSNPKDRSQGIDNKDLEVLIALESGVSLLKGAKAAASAARVVDDLIDFPSTSLFESYEKHIFSDKHMARGVMDLGTDKQDIMNKIGSLVETNLSKLREGDNFILNKVNGHESTVKAFVREGKIISIDAYKGTAKRLYGNVIK